MSAGLHTIISGSVPLSHDLRLTPRPTSQRPNLSAHPRHQRLPTSSASRSKLGTHWLHANLRCAAHTATTSNPTTISASSPPSQLPRQQSSSKAPQHPGAPQDGCTTSQPRPKDMKAGRQEESVRGHSEADNIYPTDVVDLPPPSPPYPLAVQASASHEMGVQESVRLCWRIACRRGAPGVPVSVEDDWWNALLHAAVNHSIIRPNPCQSNFDQRIISLSSTFSSTSPARTLSLCGSRCPHALTPTPSSLSTCSTRSRRPVVGGLLTETGSRAIVILCLSPRTHRGRSASSSSMCSASSPRSTYLSLPSKQRKDFVCAGPPHPRAIPMKHGREPSTRAYRGWGCGSGGYGAQATLTSTGAYHSASR
ncbi:hypothetical protein B0H13DRAFT_2387104 [Mycena leptocephala]|nr:hypothetical protein B0H13DRAFT_2387104 [Mycena leptocephala]